MPIRSEGRDHLSRKGRNAGTDRRCGRTDPMDNDVQMRGLVWQSMQFGPSLQRRGKGMHERLLDEVPPGPGHVSEVQYLFKLFLANF